LIFTLLDLIDDCSVLIFFFTEKELLNASYPCHWGGLPVAFGSKLWMLIDREVPRVLLISILTVRIA
jgi:hypothetical protein